LFLFFVKMLTGWRDHRRDGTKAKLAQESELQTKETPAMTDKE
jgi:hypothetical protein